ncbi:formimidoyltransferase-cyclodeaminase [Cavenderia fasciculata]|uniref:Formimidoyltransferase-cyclodeaminase n=1 Tax=Cavenderia fasciculata TaxID=261658 RepID=F4QAQ9_CACFS|nr:formimidoyltransferase-cyclodeaminase [Cavenderia fasciculata]EGG15778.1 formimidoyltransferase-cyclodeaminase [Cavenderia fasciculata]|eukprot:XP_004354525.1 formimidoyltransferase-cyclodeaminase [Cavenderia fasciculata]
MTSKLIECVPNFSEGRDQTVIDAISKAISSVQGCTLLNVDPGKSTNRTVYTFVGTPEAVVDAAVAATHVAHKLIDMRQHKGEHPRMGALDVCPFVPIRNATMDDCVECSKKFAERVSSELAIPIYLYEYASDQSKPYRKQLRQIREGEYEGLSEKIVKPEWKPDFGPATFVPTYGATVTGARKFLIAYNVNILGTKEQAHRIALNVREAGRSEKEPGTLPAVKGIGWYVEEFNMAQVSMNLDDYTITAIHTAFEEVKKEASLLNLAVAGSEIVGMLPLDAILKAADYYIEKENLFIIDEQQKVRLAIERLGLSSCSRFEPSKYIIDYMIKEDASVAAPLVNMTVKGFTELLGSRTAAPGGGSASALIAALGAGLGAMVGWMTYGKRKFESLDGKMRQLIKPLDEIMRELIPLIDEDTKAFNDFMAALGAKENKQQKIEQATRQIMLVPLKTMQVSNKCWIHLIEMAKYGNFASKSDLEVGAKALEAGIWGASRNVFINAKDCKDKAFVDPILKQANDILKNSEQSFKQVLDVLDSRNE